MSGRMCLGFETLWRLRGIGSDFLSGMQVRNSMRIYVMRFKPAEASFGPDDGSLPEETQAWRVKSKIVRECLLENLL